MIILRNIICINIVDVVITYIDYYRLILLLKNKRLFNELSFIVRYERLTRETETTKENI